MTLPKTKEIQDIISNQETRTAVATQSHMWFFHMYLSHYITYPTAEFQKQFFTLSEDESKNPLSVMAFRGSAKSTIFTLSYPIWSILGKQQKKFVVLLGQTQRQAKQHLINIKRELEGNDLLKQDLGPFKEQEDEWGSYSLVLPWYNARITAASMEQTIRGMRHKQYRPDLIICDDIEDLASVKTKEGRDKIYNWITSEIIPAGDLNTRLLFIGNLLHEDSFLMRLKEKIDEKELDGHFIQVPLVKDDKIAWPEKFNCLEDVKRLENKVSDKVAWEREYMLRIISTTERVIHPEWIKFYDEIPPFDDDHDFRFTATGIDLAISQKTTADYTAMVSAHVFGYKDELKIYITPNPINKRMVHKETLDTAMNLSKSLGNGDMTWILVEDVGYQKSVVQELIRAGYPAKGVKVHGSDKRSRLALTSHLVQSGVIQFPRKGAELLISQMTGFGVEKYDDLADAFSLLINKIICLDHEKYVTGIWFLNDDDEWDGAQWTIRGKEFEDD